MGFLSKFFSKLFRGGSATAGDDKSPNAHVRKDKLRKYSHDAKITSSDEIIDECRSLDSFESAKSSEKVEEHQPAKIDDAKRSTPLGLQPRPSIRLIRDKLRLPTDDARPASSQEKKTQQNVTAKNPISVTFSKCNSDDLRLVPTASSIDQDEYDASYSINTPNITFGTTLTAVGAFVAEADQMRSTSQPATTLALNAANEGYYSGMATNNRVKLPKMVSSQHSRLSISSIHSPVESISTNNILPQAYNIHSDSPASSSSSAREDEFSSQRRRPFSLGDFHFDPISLPPYQMIETPEKRGSRRKKQPSQKRISTSSSRSLKQLAFPSTTKDLAACIHSEVYTHSMAMTSPSSSVDRHYSGDDDSSSEDEQDVPQLMLLSPSRTSSSAHNVMTPMQQHNHNSSLMMTSPSSCSVYPQRTYCNASKAARYLEASFEQAVLQKRTAAAMAVLPPRRAQLKTHTSIRSQSDMVVSSCHRNVITSIPSDSSLFNEPSYITNNESSMDVNLNEESMELANLSTLSLLKRDRKEGFTSDAECKLIRVDSNSKGQLPYDFDIIDGVNYLSDSAFDPSFNDVSDITYLNHTESCAAVKNKNLISEEAHRLSFSDYNKIFLLSSTDAVKEEYIVSHENSGDKEEERRNMAVTKQSQPLLVPSPDNGKLLLERKRQNQWKSKAILLQGMIWRLQDNLALVVEVEAQSDDFYERCPRYVQSSSSDGPPFVKTMSNQEGIIPSYTENTRTKLLHRLEYIHNYVGEIDIDLVDALKFVISLLERRQDEHETAILLETHISARKVLRVGESQVSPGFTAPTASHIDANTSLASTISSKASIIRRSDVANGDRTRRTILITCSLLQKITYALQNLMSDERQSKIDVSKNTVRHSYLQLMNLSRKDIQEVLDLFSVKEEDNDSAVKLDASIVYNTDLIILAPLLPVQLSASHEESSDSHHETVGSSWMKKYEAVMDNILSKQVQNLNEVAPVDSGDVTDELNVGEGHLLRSLIKLPSEEAVEDNDENKNIFTSLAHDDTLQAEYAKNKNLSKKQGKRSEMESADLNFRTNRIVFGSL